MRAEAAGATPVGAKVRQGMNPSSWVREPFRRERPSLAGHVDGLVGGFPVILPPPAIQRRAVLRDLAWVIVYVETVRDSGEVGEDLAGELDRWTEHLGGLIARFSSADDLRLWRATTHLEDPLRWRRLYGIEEEARRESLQLMARSAFLVSLELETTGERFDTAGWWAGRLEALAEEVAASMLVEPELGPKLIRFAVRLRSLAGAEPLALVGARAGRTP
jgi:hypothetical protein